MMRVLQVFRCSRRSPSPEPDPIPAPWWVFELLGVITLTIHLLLVNVVIGSVLLKVWTLIRRGVSATVASKLTSSVPIVLALAINFGVAPLLFVQVNYGHLIYTSSIFMGVYASPIEPSWTTTAHLPARAG